MTANYHRLTKLNLRRYDFLHVNDLALKHRVTDQAEASDHRPVPANPCFSLSRFRIVTSYTCRTFFLLTVKLCYSRFRWPSGCLSRCYLESVGPRTPGSRWDLASSGWGP